VKNGKLRAWLRWPSPRSSSLSGTSCVGPVSELVRQVVVELVREQLNGAAPGLGPSTDTAVSGPENAQERRRRPGPRPKPAPAERRCNRCGETKPAGEYAKGRGPAAAAGAPSSASMTGAQRSPTTRTRTQSGLTRKPGDGERAA
jgi:hypothetical protein